MAVILTGIFVTMLLADEGYLTVKDVFIIFMIFVLGTLGGYISFCFFIYLLKERYEGFWKKLLGVKVFRTKQYKTKKLLYKEDEDEQ